MLPMTTPATGSELEATTMNEIMKLLISQGTGGILPIFKSLMNQAMKIERNNAIGADPYERNEERIGHANGYKDKTINTSLGKITLDIPQARGMKFFPESLEKGMRSERALKLAIAEMYVNGVSTRKVAHITEKLCGLDISSTQVSNCSKLLDKDFEAFRNRSLGHFMYVQFDAIYEKIRHCGTVKSLPILVAIGIDTFWQATIIITHRRQLFLPIFRQSNINLVHYYLS